VKNSLVLILTENHLLGSEALVCLGEANYEGRQIAGIHQAIHDAEQFNPALFILDATFITSKSEPLDVDNIDNRVESTLIATLQKMNIPLLVITENLIDSASIKARTNPAAIFENANMRSELSQWLNKHGLMPIAEPDFPMSLPDLPLPIEDLPLPDLELPPIDLQTPMTTPVPPPRPLSSMATPIPPPPRPRSSMATPATPPPRPRSSMVTPAPPPPRPRSSMVTPAPPAQRPISATHTPESIIEETFSPIKTNHRPAIKRPVTVSAKALETVKAPLPPIVDSIDLKAPKEKKARPATFDISQYDEESANNDEESANINETQILKHILVIDRNPLIQHTLRELAYAGLAYEWASDIGDGATLLQNQQPAAVFIQEELEDITGLQACKYINNIPVFSNLPLFIITNETSSLTTEQCRNAGAVGVISEPFTSTEFMQFLTEYGLLIQH